MHAAFMMDKLETDMREMKAQGEKSEHWFHDAGIFEHELGGGGARKCNIEALHTCKFYVSKYPPHPLPLKTMHNMYPRPRDLHIGCYGNQGHLPPLQVP